MIATPKIRRIRKLTALDVAPVDGRDGRDADESAIIDEVLSKIPKPKDGLQGKDGKDGKPGKDGSDAPDLQTIINSIAPHIPAGADGLPGKDAPSLSEIVEAVTPFIPEAIQGKDGKTPDHEIDKKRLRLRFRKADGKWGEWLELGKELSTLIAKQVGFVNRGGVSDKAKRSRNHKEITADYSAVLSDYLIKGDCTSGAITTTLPNVADAAGLSFILKKVDSTGNSYNFTGDANIDGQSTICITQRYTALEVFSDGEEWHII